jgi:NAD+ synthase (glutamine-hydrolysing)
MLKIALVQLNFQVGNFEDNVSQIINNIHSAKANNAQLVVFSELSVCGYPARDFLTYDHFIQQCYKSIDKIANECVGITAIVGAPSANKIIAGKNIYNSAYVLSNGKVQTIVNKSLLPTYDVFDEYRYFESNTNDFNCVDINGIKIALTVCEDLWDIAPDKMYKQTPMEALVKQAPALMINIAASPFNYEHREDRLTTFKKNCIQYNLPLLYVNSVGAQTELIFDGGSLAIDAHGNIIDELNYFTQDVRFFEFDNNTLTSCSIPTQNSNSNTSKIARIHNALVLGISDYFKKLGFTKAILGLSGGIDSALVAVLAVRALGANNVKVLLLPSAYSSDHSINDAIALANNLGIVYEIVPITNATNAVEATLADAFKNLPLNVAEENIQARMRGLLLMAHSNKFGYVLLNTTNKSEAAVGYGTLYGDMCGGLAVLGDVYKTECYELANYINKDTVVLPINTITKPPSAELRPNQKDSDSLPQYDVLDAILKLYIEHRLAPEHIITKGFDAALVNSVLAMVNRNEYKRFQLAPVLRVSPKAFGMGRRMPLEGKYV